MYNEVLALTMSVGKGTNYVGFKTCLLKLLIGSDTFDKLQTKNYKLNQLQQMHCSINCVFYYEFPPYITYGVSTNTYINVYYIQQSST